MRRRREHSAVDAGVEFKRRGSGRCVIPSVSERCGCKTDEVTADVRVSPAVLHLTTEQKMAVAAAVVAATAATAIRKGVLVSRPTL